MVTLLIRGSAQALDPSVKACRLEVDAQNAQLLAGVQERDLLVAARATASAILLFLIISTALSRTPFLPRAARLGLGLLFLLLA